MLEHGTRMSDVPLGAVDRLRTSRLAEKFQVRATIPPMSPKQMAVLLFQFDGRVHHPPVRGKHRPSESGEIDTGNVIRA